MSKRVSLHKVSVETWNVKTTDTKKFPSGRKVAPKIAIRDTLGRFHGATNFKGTLLG